MDLTYFSLQIVEGFYALGNEKGGSIIEPSLVVGWFEVELMRNLRFLMSVLCEEGAWVVNCRKLVDCEAVCDLLSRFYPVVL